MADQERQHEEEVVEATAEAEPTAHPEAETHTMAEIEAENLHEPDEVQEMESVPPYEERSDVPAEMEEVREVAPATPQADIQPEKQLGPLTGSGWFMALSVVAFILAIIVQAL